MISFKAVDLPGAKDPSSAYTAETIGTSWPMMTQPFKHLLPLTEAQRRQGAGH